jgi:hypothetical protein
MISCVTPACTGGARIAPLSGRRKSRLPELKQAGSPVQGSPGRFRVLLIGPSAKAVRPRAVWRLTNFTQIYLSGSPNNGGNWDSGEHKRVMIHQGQGRMRMLG